jgi:hypothetical protein
MNCNTNRLRRILFLFPSIVKRKEKLQDMIKDDDMMLVTTLAHVLVSFIIINMTIKTAYKATTSNHKPTIKRISLTGY